MLAEALVLVLSAAPGRPAGPCPDAAPDGLGLPTVESVHQPAAVRAPLPATAALLRTDLKLAVPGWPFGIALAPVAQPPEALAALMDRPAALLGWLWLAASGSASDLAQGLAGAPAVNTRSGNLVVCALDLLDPGYGLNAAFYRVHNSLEPGAGAFGPGWSHNFAARLEVQPGGALRYVRWDGARAVFRAAGGGAWLAPPGTGDRLARQGDGWRLEDRTGFALEFDAAGRLAALADRRGRRLECAYRDGRLAAVTVASLPGGAVVPPPEERVAAGAGIYLLYDDHGRIRRARTGAGAVLDYEYGADGRLERVTSAAGAGVRYGYTPGGRVSDILDPEGDGGMAVRYDAAGRVAELTAQPRGETVRFVREEEGGTRIETGRANRWVYHRYDACGNLVGRDGDRSRGAGVTVARDAAGRKVRQEAGDGTWTAWTYDGAGRLTAASSSRGRRVTVAYDPATGLPATLTDSEGRAARVTYRENGEVATLQLPGGGIVAVEEDARGVPATLTAADGARVGFTPPRAAGLLPPVPEF